MNVHLKRIHKAIKGLIYACLSGFTLLTGTLLLLGSRVGAAIAFFVVSAICFLILLRSLVDLAVAERLDKF